MLVAALGTFGMVILVLLASCFIVGDRRHPPYGLAASPRYLVPLTFAPLVCVFCLFAWADLEREPSPSATGGTGLYAFTVVVGSVTVMGLVWSLLGFLTTPRKQPRPPPNRPDRDPRAQARRMGHQRTGAVLPTASDEQPRAAKSDEDCSMCRRPRTKWARLVGSGLQCPKCKARYCSDCRRLTVLYNGGSDLGHWYWCRHCDHEWSSWDLE